MLFTGSTGVDGRFSSWIEGFISTIYKKCLFNDIIWVELELIL